MSGNQTREEAIRRVATAVTKMMMKDGRLIELGFRLFLLHSFTLDGEVPTAGLPAGMGEHQYDQLRSAFFAGSQHLFGSLMVGLDEDREITQDDMQKMELIDSELRVFITDFKKRHGIPDEPEEKRQ